MNPFGEQKNLGLLFARAQANAHVHFERERERERERNIWIERGNSGVQQGGFEKNPLRILSVNRASPADDIAVENAVDNKNFARTRTS